MEKIGIDVLKPDLGTAAKIADTVYGVFVDHDGIWKLFGLSGLISDLKSSDFKAAGAQAMDLDPAEAAECKDEINKNLRPVLAAKLAPVEDVGLRLFALVERVVNFGKEVVPDTVALWNDVKTLFSL